jgi:hypothetical protein
LDNSSRILYDNAHREFGIKSRCRDAPFWALSIPHIGDISGRLAMPQFYFHVRRGQITILDHEGIELVDTVDAEGEAAERAQQIVDGESLNGEYASRRRIIVADDNWETLFEFTF